jgi:predicted ATP-grasp superfamily ATP-dependent carboligase
MIGFNISMLKSHDKTTAPTVIVLGVDTPIGVAILRDLGRGGYNTIAIGRSKTSIGFASRFCHHALVRESTEEGLIRQLQSVSERFPSAALISISETDNLLINRHRDRLSSALHILAPTKEMLDQVIDKYQCLTQAKKLGIRVPETFLPNTLQEIEERCHDLSYPCVIKWADPNEVAQDLEKAGLKLHKYEYAKNAPDLVDKLRPYAAINRFPLVQEYCPGKGIGQMFLAHQGEVVLEFQHQRIHEWPPEGGVSTLCQSVPLELHQACRKLSAALLKALQWDGVAMVEYRYDDTTDSYYFMEINGRFWGSLPLAIAAGVPFAAALVDKALNGPSTIRQPDYSRLYCRFMFPEIRRIARLVFQPKAIQDPYYRYNRIEEMGAFLLYFVHPKSRYYLFSFSDPGPFFADIKNLLRKTVFASG